MRRAGMLAMVLMCFMPAAAEAGTYEVWSCADENGRPAPADGWEAPPPGPASRSFDSCLYGRGLVSLLSGADAVPQDTREYWMFRAPKDTKIVSARVWRSVRLRPGNAQAIPAYTFHFSDGPEAYGPQVEFCNAQLETGPCSALGTGQPLGDGTLVNVPSVPGRRELWLNLTCAGNGPCAVGEGDTGEVQMHRAAIRLQDDSAPAFLGPPAGSLTLPIPMAGVQSVTFAATDTGSGIQTATLEVDGKPAVSQVLGCPAPHTARVPCQLEARGALALDTATLADGPHALRVLLTDATGENTVASDAFTITTANAPSSCAAAESPRFSVAFDRRRATIGYGGKLNVRGMLGGVPAGTEVLVWSQIARPGDPARFRPTPLRTDAAGRFTYRVPAGPSRTLRFATRLPGELAYSCSKPLAIKVRPKVTLSASPRSIRSGRRVRFSGRLRGGYVPRAGKVVELQAFERGRWRTFRTVRSNASGVFSYRYRFSFRASGTTFPVRARVRHDASYPWALGTSRSVRVRVR